MTGLTKAIREVKVSFLMRSGEKEPSKEPSPSLQPAWLLSQREREQKSPGLLSTWGGVCRTPQGPKEGAISQPDTNTALRDPSRLSARVTSTQRLIFANVQMHRWVTSGPLLLPCSLPACSGPSGSFFVTSHLPAEPLCLSSCAED